MSVFSCVSEREEGCSWVVKLDVEKCCVGLFVCMKLSVYEIVCVGECWRVAVWG